MTVDLKNLTNTIPPKFTLLAATLVSGAAVMMYEFIAVRILQRYFGGRLDVWASEIAVCMGGLALGYFLGGKLADRYRSPRIVGLGLVFAGLTGALIKVLAETAGEGLLEVDTGLAWHPLIAASVSSFLPFIALGAVVPQVIRILTPGLESLGTATGNIVALSTVGSIVGVLATGMYLLTHFGVTETLYATSVLLVVTGIVLALPRAGIGAAILAAAFSWSQSADAQILFEDYSAYHHILVEDTRDMRVLWFDNEQETIMFHSDPQGSGFEYADFFHVPMIVDPTIRRVLFMGLGGATGPKSFLSRYPNLSVEVAEIDPMVVEIAREYFHLRRDSRLSIKVQDARAYLQRARGRYGAIFMDAYSAGPRGGYIPYHLVTQEFFQLASDKLVNGGSLTFNVITHYGKGSVLRDVYWTLRSVFHVVYPFYAETSKNVVLVAVKVDPATLRPDGTRDGREWPDGPWLNHPLDAAGFKSMVEELARRGRPILQGMDYRVTQLDRLPRRGRILTDNFAPVDAAPRR